MQETGSNNPSLEIPTWRQGLYYVREINQHPYRDNCDDEYWAKFYPCKEGVNYFGRGSKQMTYSYNYGPFSEIIFGDVTVLLNNPDLVATDPFLAFASAIWFGMTPQVFKTIMKKYKYIHNIMND